MSSISGKEGSYDSLYAACKAGVSLREITRAARSGSRLNFISPGVVCDAGMTTRRVIRKCEATFITPSRELTTSAVARLVFTLLFDRNINMGISRLTVAR